jgi:hypothetical protein
MLEGDFFERRRERQTVVLDAPKRPIHIVEYLEMGQAARFYQRSASPVKSVDPTFGAADRKACDNTDRNKFRRYAFYLSGFVIFGGYFDFKYNRQYLDRKNPMAAILYPF